MVVIVTFRSRTVCIFIRIVFFTFRIRDLPFVHHSCASTEFYLYQMQKGRTFCCAIVELLTVIHWIVEFQLKITASQLNIRRGVFQFT